LVNRLNRINWLIVGLAISVWREITNWQFAITNEQMTIERRNLIGSFQLPMNE